MQLRVVPEDLVRVLLFKLGSSDPIDLRLLLSMSRLPCETRVFDQTWPGIERAGRLLGSGGPLPSMVVFDQEERGVLSARILCMIRSHPQLRSLPVVVLGDGRHPQARSLAYQDGAHGFVARPDGDTDFRRAGVDIARFWTQYWRPQTA